MSLFVAQFITLIVRGSRSHCHASPITLFWNMLPLETWYPARITFCSHRQELCLMFCHICLAHNSQIPTDSFYPILFHAWHSELFHMKSSSSSNFHSCGIFYGCWFQRSLNSKFQRNMESCELSDGGNILSKWEQGEQQTERTYLPRSPLWLYWWPSYSECS